MSQLAYQLADIAVQKEVERHLFGLLEALKALHPRQIKNIRIHVESGLVLITVDSARAIFEMPKADYINYRDDPEREGSYLVYAKIDGIHYEAELESLGQYNALIMEFMG